MGRVSLPEGVAPTNSKNAPEDAAGFAVPETATPDFVAAENRRSAVGAVQAGKQRPLKSGRFYRFEEDDDDDDEEKAQKKDPVHIVHGAHAPGPVIILVAVGLVLAALAAFVIARNQPQPLPLCSEQPDWNQYNCLAG